MCWRRAAAKAGWKRTGGRMSPMADFLLELFSEEIPARMQARACDDLARLFNERMADAGLKAGAVETYVTPRRLALIARALPTETEAVRAAPRGPRADAPGPALGGVPRDADGP